MSQNLHKLYYKDYYSNINNWEKGDKDTEIEVMKKNALLTNSHLFIINRNPALHKHFFQLNILYPGLVTGVGIDHETTIIDGELKLGMHFDWTYGMPVIYGSSVKGLLRSYFEDFYSPKADQPPLKDVFIDIFEGSGKSIYNRDVFFDAVIVKADKKGRILCTDSITPHGENPLQNPIPLPFLKIAPGCQIEFRFKLVDTKITKEGRELILKSQDKLDLFKEILTTVGIGAKTNVGYGQLKPV